MKHRILIADDEQKIRRVINLLLQEAGYETKMVENGKQAIESINTFKPHLILLDYQMPVMSGIEALNQIKEAVPSPSVVMITAYGSVSLVVEAIKKGAYDFIEKPFDNDKLLLTVKRAIEHAGLKNEVKELREKLEKINDSASIIGEKCGLKKVMEQVQVVSPTNATVLLSGESGTGKELIARRIHQMSIRSNNPFIALNCGAIPQSLIESELFGYEKGAFTDAKETYAGNFERACKGTLFLDEIGELPLGAQVKLLRVLEEKKITRLGGKSTVDTDVRIIAATNRDLEERVRAGEFRLDLLYRLNIFSINLPPLRERKEDIILLTEYFISKYNKILNLNIEGITPETLTLIQNYDWPGNVRDLENAIQSALIMTQKGKIKTETLPPRIKRYIGTELTTTEIEKIKGNKIRSVGIMAEKELIVAVLNKNSNSKTATASELNISRKTLFNKMKKFGLI